MCRFGCGVPPRLRFCHIARRAGAGCDQRPILVTPPFARDALGGRAAPPPAPAAGAVPAAAGPPLVQRSLRLLRDKPSPSGLRI